jgi:hypothetical protein
MGLIFFFVTQDDLNLLLFLMFCLYLCVYLGVYLCYGISKEDIRITQSLRKGLVKDFLS